MQAVQLGDTVRDRITGFEGVVTGRVEYITGCNQLLVSPRVKDGAKQDACWFDEQRCEVDVSAERIVLDNSKTPGADMPAPIR